MTAAASGQRPVFSIGVVAGLAAAGILAFAAFMVLLAYGDAFRSGRDGRGHARSGSAVGFRGLVDLTRYSGRNAVLIRTEDDLETEDLVVVTIEPNLDKDVLDRLVAVRGHGPTLLVLPKWSTSPHPIHSGWVRAGGLIDGDYIASLLDHLVEAKVAPGDVRQGTPLKGNKYLEPLRLRAPVRLQTISGEDLEPMVVTPSGKTVLGQVGESRLFILSDPDLMNNHALKDPAAAAGALALLDELNSTGAEGIRFDLTLNGFARQANVLKLAFEPPFLPMTLAIFVTALLAGLHGAFRFGPERTEGRAIAFGKAALVENSAGLIRLARREHRVGAAYADLIREEAAHATGAPAGLRAAELDLYLDRFTAPDGAPFSELADRARHASDRHELVSAAHALFTWKRNIIQ